MIDDDFARAEQGANLLVALGLPIVSVVDAVRAWRASTTPHLTLFDELEDAA